MKTCKACSKQKQPDAFLTVNSRGRTYKRGTCKQCENERIRDRRKSDPDFRRRANDASRKYKYGISGEEFRALMNSQGGRCAICKTGDPGKYGWMVDHDHSCCPGDSALCGKCNRGILCRGCNLGIGNFRDDVDAILSAAEYLQRQQPI